LKQGGTFNWQKDGWIEEKGSIAFWVVTMHDFDDGWLAVAVACRSFPEMASAPSETHPHL